MMFSVIVPCYNSKSYVRKCIDSILAQNYHNFEIILIDDGSTDGTAQILDDYATVYSYIHAYHFENSGVSHSRRRGIALATGDYLVFVDSDDTINPQLLHELSLTVEEHDFPDIIRYQANLVGDAKHKDHQRYNFDENLNVSQTGLDVLKQWSVPGKKYALYWLFAFKGNVFANVLFTIDLRCYEDVALIPVLIAASKKVVTIGYVGYNYTYNNFNSLTNTCSLDSERQKALDFIYAYKYAVENFSKLDNVSSLDIAFFYEDYTKRLRGKYESLPEELKIELADAFQV